MGITRLAVTSLTIFIGSFSVATSAVILKPIDLPEELRPPATQEPSTPECDQIYDRLSKYKDDMIKRNDGTTGFVSDVSRKISTWYDELSPLEGTQQTIPVGTFETLTKGTEAIDEVKGWLYDLNDAATIEVEKILEGLQNCKITKAAP